VDDPNKSALGGRAQKPTEPRIDVPLLGIAGGFHAPVR